MKVLFASLVLALAGQAFSADTMKHKTTATKTSSMKPTQLDDLIRGEMSAVKTYDQVLEKVKDQQEVTKLTAIRKDHQNAVATLKKYADKDVKDDTRTVGPWGTFTEAWTGAAKLMGNETALKALNQGEEHGISEYKEALNDDTIKAELKQMIKEQFLPKQEEHIKALKTFM